MREAGVFARGLHTPIMVDVVTENYGRRLTGERRGEENYNELERS